MKAFVNGLTVSRIIGSIVMCFLSVLSIPFYIVYVYSGFTDFLDGFLARKFNVTSKLGSKLDSIADLTYYTVMMTKIWPYLCSHLYLSTWIIIWSVLGVRILLYLYIQIKYHHLISTHHFLNKLTGAMMFLLPFLVNNKNIFRTYSVIVSLVAVAACVDEIITLGTTVKNEYQKQN